MTGTGLEFEYDDGGRKAAGFRGAASDCTCRAIAIATGTAYRDVYDALNDAATRERRPKRGTKSSARTGVKRTTIRRFLADCGWTWVPTMGIGTGCRVHMRAEELPIGTLILSLSKHLTVVRIFGGEHGQWGVIRDTYDPSREGTRCVYGYWHQVPA